MKKNVRKVENPVPNKAHEKPSFKGLFYFGQSGSPDPDKTVLQK
ncbi:hypothetical protein [Paenibacillus larvae]|nr:hypothetical protein [Paenibacillus larvae]MDR5608987.1 hypothetical protein [Paenibacillus larvae]MEB8593751.1 hypothetical protein [Bacillus cereus]